MGNNGLVLYVLIFVHPCIVLKAVKIVQWWVIFQWFLVIGTCKMIFISIWNISIVVKNVYLHVYCTNWKACCELKPSIYRQNTQYLKDLHSPLLWFQHRSYYFFYRSMHFLIDMNKNLVDQQWFFRKSRIRIESFSIHFPLKWWSNICKGFLCP